MKVIHFILKTALLPVLLVMTLIQWIGILLTGIFGIFLGILSFIIALTGIASLLFGLASGGECMQMIVTAFVIFLIPHIGNWLIERIIFLRFIIGDFIRS